MISAVIALLVIASTESAVDLAIEDARPPATADHMRPELDAAARELLAGVVLRNLGAELAARVEVLVRVLEWSAGPVEPGVVELLVALEVIVRRAEDDRELDRRVVRHATRDVGSEPNRSGEWPRRRLAAMIDRAVSEEAIERIKLGLGEPPLVAALTSTRTSTWALERTRVSREIEYFLSPDRRAMGALQLGWVASRMRGRIEHGFQIAMLGLVHPSFDAGFDVLIRGAPAFGPPAEQARAREINLQLVANAVWPATTWLELYAGAGIGGGEQNFTFKSAGFRSQCTTTHNVIPAHACVPGSPGAGAGARLKRYLLAMRARAGARFDFSSASPVLLGLFVEAFYDLTVPLSSWKVEYLDGGVEAEAILAAKLSDPTAGDGAAPFGATFGIAVGF